MRFSTIHIIRKLTFYDSRHFMWQETGNYRSENFKADSTDINSGPGKMEYELLG